MDEGREKLDEAYVVLQREVPDPISNALRWLRNPEARWVRLPLGLLFVAGSFFWFLPVVGLEWLPLGLLLIAQDVPPLRKPAATLTLWLEGRWRRLKRRWKRYWAERGTG